MDELLLRRLEELEQDKASRDFDTQKKGFMDKYGTMFNGDEGIGTAILAQFNRMGIDTSAADRAVQEIVNDIRQQAIEILDKLGAVEQAIDAAQQGGMGPDLAPPPPMEEAPPDMGAPPPDMGAPPPPMEEPPPPPPDMGAPPPDMGAPPPDMGVPSDEKVKDVEKSEKKEVSDVDLKDADKDEPVEEANPDEAEAEVFNDEGLDSGTLGTDTEMLGEDIEEEFDEDDELVPLNIEKITEIWTDDFNVPELEADEAEFIANLLMRGR